MERIVIVINSVTVRVSRRYMIMSNVIYSISVPVDSAAHRIISGIDDGGRSEMIRLAIENMPRLQALMKSQYTLRYLLGQEGWCPRDLYKPSGLKESWGDEHKYPLCCEACEASVRNGRNDGETAKEYRRRISSLYEAKRVLRQNG